MKSRNLKNRMSRLERARGGGQPTGRGARAWASLSDEQFKAFFSKGELPTGIALEELLGPAWIRLSVEQVAFIIEHGGEFPPGVNVDGLFEDMPQFTEAQRLLLSPDDDHNDEPRGSLINAPPIPSR
jgi:hypothetical protein